MSQDDSSTTQRRALAMSVHLLTASGALWALLTLDAIISGDYRMAFLWMFVAMFVDSVDGPLARKVDVKRHAPHIDGARLCLLYTSPSPRDRSLSRMPSSA